MNINKQNFLYKLSHIRKSAFTFLEREMERGGITDIPPSFGDILFIIFKQGTPYVKDIVAGSFKDKSTVSNSINHLEKKGYVEKIPDEEDGRRVRVRLTKKAGDYISDMDDISARLQKKIFNGMSDEEMSILFMLMNKIERNLKE